MIENKSAVDLYYRDKWVHHNLYLLNQLMPVYVCKSTRSPFITMGIAVIHDVFAKLFSFFVQNIAGAQWKMWTFAANFGHGVCSVPQEVSIKNELAN